MTQPATVPSSVTAPLGALTASTLYLMAMQTDGSTRKVVCIQFAPGTMIQNDSSGALQFISTGVTSGAIPISAMNMTGSTSQYVCGDGSLANFPALGSAALVSTSTFDAAGAASTAQAYAIQRSNQTGTQTASTISDFSSAAIAAVTWSTLTGKPTFATVATSGSYTDLSSKPSLGTQMTVDSGWTVNNTVGDKTAALSSYSNGINGTMVSALNVVSSGTGTALSAGFDVLVTVVKQIAAIRTALIAAKLPNV